MIENQKLQKLTILHSNDIHADFLPKEGKNGKTGGIAYLSGYLQSKRSQAPDSTIYVFSGDMFTGSLIDLDSRGMETVKIMNHINPTVATIGNHEVDYQLSCLSYYKECCNYPLVCANLWDEFYGRTFFRPYVIITVGGMNILFIGVVTHELMRKSAKDFLIRLNLRYLNPEPAIKRVYNEVKEKDIPVHMTVVVSHLGLAEDRQLAKELAASELPVDMIIGGHSHTLMDEMDVVDGIRIVQAGIGTSQIGRFEITYNLDSNEIQDCQWCTDVIECDKIIPDKPLEEEIKNYEKKLKKLGYYELLSTLREKGPDGNYTERAAENPTRYKGTEVGNLVCDALKEHFSLDIVIIGSGSLRKTRMESDVTRAELMEMYTYPDEHLYMIWLTGAELKTAMKTFLKKAPVITADDKEDYHEEFFQISRGFHFVYSRKYDELYAKMVTQDGETDIPDDELFKVGIETYHLNNLTDHLGLYNTEEIKQRKNDNVGKRKKSGSIQYSLKEYLKEHTYVDILREKRVEIID